MLHRLLHGSRVALCFVWCVAALCGCRTETEIRLQNVSTLDFTEVRVAGTAYGTLPAGTTSPYRNVGLNFKHAALELTAAGHRITGQTLNLKAKRFTYQIDVVDAAAGHLAIEVVGE